MSDNPTPAPPPNTTASRTRLAVVLLAVTFLIIAATATLAALGAKPGSIGDFGCFYNAGVAYRLAETPYLPLEQQTHPLYSPDGGWWVYPPGPAVVFVPLTYLSPINAQIAWIALGALLSFLTVHLLADEVARRLRAPRDLLTVAVFAVVPTALMADKFSSVFELGQTEPLILTCLVLALRWIDRRPLAAGAALAVAISFKYIAIAFIPYLIVRRRFKTLAGIAIGTLVVAAAPIPSYGLSGTLDLHASAFGGLAHMVGVEVEHTFPRLHQITWIRSISIPSGFARLADAIGAPHALAYAASAAVALACLALAWTMYARANQPLVLNRPLKDESARPDRELLVLLEFSAIITAALVFSPQTTVRHVMIMLIPMTAATGLALADDTPRPRWPLLAALIAHTLGLVLPPGGDRFADALHTWRAISANSLLALVLLYTTLHFGLRHARALADATRPESHGKSGPAR